MSKSAGRYINWKLKCNPPEWSVNHRGNGRVSRQALGPRVGSSKDHPAESAAKSSPVISMSATAVSHLARCHCLPIIIYVMTTNLLRRVTLIHFYGVVNHSFSPPFDMAESIYPLKVRSFNLDCSLYQHQDSS